MWSNFAPIAMVGALWASLPAMAAVRPPPPAASAAPDTATNEAELQRLLKAPSEFMNKLKACLPDDEVRRRVLAVFAREPLHLLFHEGVRLTAAGQNLARFVAAIADHGLSPRRYLRDAVQGNVAQTPSAQICQDALLVRAADLLLSDFHNWSKPDIKALISEVESASRDMAGWLQRLQPRHPQYAALVRTFHRYLENWKKGPLHVIGSLSKPLAVGASGPAVTRLRQRLLQEEIFGADSGSSAFDESLAAGLKAFQRSRGLPDSGILDSATAERLDEPWLTWLRQLRLALERWRVSGTRQLKTYIRVNLPAFMTEVWVDGHLERELRSVIGTTHRGKTPVLSGFINSMVFNPSWHVPEAVKRVDLDGRAARIPDFWQKNGFTLRPLSDGRMMAVQRPGPDNWLGRVIFKMSTGTNIFLHDTPRQELFAETQRTFSHGCVNVEHALDLAKRLLELDDQALLAKQMPKWLEDCKTRKVALKHVVPVFLEYVTVVIQADGSARFLRDIYRYDQSGLVRIRFDQF